MPGSRAWSAKARTATIRETCPHCHALFEYTGVAPLAAVKDFRRAHTGCKDEKRDGESKRD